MILFGIVIFVMGICTGLMIFDRMDKFVARREEEKENDNT